MLSSLTDPKFGLFAKGPLSQLHFRFLKNTITKKVEVTYMMYGLPEGAVIPIIFKDQNSDFYKVQTSFNVKDAEREECKTFTSNESVVAPSFASVIYDQVGNIKDSCSSDCSDKESVSGDEGSVSGDEGSVSGDDGVSDCCCGSISAGPDSHQGKIEAAIIDSAPFAMHGRGEALGLSYFQFVNSRHPKPSEPPCSILQASCSTEQLETVCRNNVDPAEFSGSAKASNIFKTGHMASKPGVETLDIAQQWKEFLDPANFVNPPKDGKLGGYQTGEAAAYVEKHPEKLPQSLVSIMKLLPELKTDPEAADHLRNRLINGGNRLSNYNRDDMDSRLASAPVHKLCG